MRRKGVVFSKMFVLRSLGNELLPSPLLHEQVVQPPVLAVGAGVDYLDIFTSLKTERYDGGLLDTKGHTVS